MLAIVLAFYTFLAWGAGDIFATFATRKLNGYTYVFWGNVLNTLLGVLYFPFAWHDLQAMTRYLLLIICVLAVVFTVAVVAFYEALRIENPSLVGTITSAFVGLTVLFSIIFLQEVIQGRQLIAIAAILVGIIACSIDMKLFLANKVRLTKGVVLALVSMACFGIYYAFIKIPIEAVGWFWPMHITFASDRRRLSRTVRCACLFGL